MAALWDLGVVEAASAIRNGEVTAEKLAETLIARVAANADLNAFITFEPDRVREAARAVDQRRASGAALGPLDGVPLALKDNLDTSDLPTSGGTPALKGHRPKRNAVVVDSLLKTGAIALGKCNLHELAFGITNNNGHFGPARNPYATDRIPGGSSGGTGVAVAARLAPAGVGTDTGGSVRVPAALCGIVGFRPSTGRWSQSGVVPISHTRDTPGPMARCVADCALLDEVVTGAPTELAGVNLAGLRIGVPRKPLWEDIDPELGKICEGVLRRLAEANAVLVDVDLTEEAKIDAEIGFPIALHEAVEDLGAYLTGHDLKLAFADVARSTGSPDVNGILTSLIGAGAVPAEVYCKSLEQRAVLQKAFSRDFAAQGISAVIFPATPAPAAPIGDDETFQLNGTPHPTFATFVRNSGPGSVAGIPGISLPAGLTAAGLPVGIELSGPAGSDRDLLAIAAAVERLLPKLPPPQVRT